MNDDQAAKDVSDAVAQHGGWVIAALVSSYLWILKIATSRTVKQLDRIEFKLDNFGERLAKLEGRMDSVE